MRFAIFCIDKPGMAEVRKTATEAHIAYLSTDPIKVVVSGPLMSDDGAAIVGSMFIVDAADRAEVEAFQKDDPLVAAAVWQSVEVRAFNMRVDNRD